MNAARLLLLAPFLAACSLGSTGDVDESARTTTKNLPRPDQEVRDYEPDAPVVVENGEDLYRGLQRADFSPTIETKSSDASFSLVDHDTPVKSQDSRPWCTAFAQIAVMENVVRHGRKEIVDLSEIDHWSHYRQLSLWGSAKAAQSTLIVPESSYPYYGSPIANYRSTAIARITGWRNITTRAQVFASIRAGRPVVIGLDLNSSWNSPGPKGRIRTSGGYGGGHAMAVVGYQEDPSYEGGGYMLIKNSWGSKWGDLGYARMPYDYCIRGNCYFIETLGVEYAGKVVDLSAPPPPVPEPGAEITAADLAVVTVKDTAQANRFKLRLVEKKSGALAQVAKVVYDVHETFKDYRFWTIEDASNGFEIPFFYTTYHKGRWRTNGAAVTTKSGKTVTLEGALVDWFHVD